MQNILSLLQKRGEILHILVHVDLRRACLGTVDHGLIEVLHGNRLSHIILVLLSVH